MDGDAPPSPTSAQKRRLKRLEEWKRRQQQKSDSSAPEDAAAVAGASAQQDAAPIRLSIGGARRGVKRSRAAGRPSLFQESSAAPTGAEIAPRRRPRPQKPAPPEAAADAAAAPAGDDDPLDAYMASLGGSAERQRGAGAAAPEDGGRGLGRLFNDDGGVMDEKERLEHSRRVLESLQSGAPAASSSRRKVLKPVDHSAVEYPPLRKRLWITPPSLEGVDAEAQRLTLGISVAAGGAAVPPPVSRWEQCGFSDALHRVLETYGWKAPFAIQKQLVPIALCGADAIAVAKTGSGKTLAYLLPSFRALLDQLDAAPFEKGDGPLLLVLAPARELGLQIASEARRFADALNLRVASLVGGGSLKEQLAQLRRGSQVAVCTPGRLIEVLCLNNGRALSLRRTSIVVLDEADRMLDMGFEPQVRAILSHVRPDRQTLLFSATFPSGLERLARAFLPGAVQVRAGGLAAAPESVEQIVEVHEEGDKFRRLLQLLGVWFERGQTIAFVASQDKCDALLSKLVKSGYPCVALHANMDAADRTSSLDAFKAGDARLLVATAGTAGRGLDVPSVTCVINVSCPTHLEDYVHQVGRTGRAGRKGTAYTFVSPREEMYAKGVARALRASGKDPPAPLVALVRSFDRKLRSGEAQRPSSGFTGKGFAFDESDKTAHFALQKEAASAAAPPPEPADEDAEALREAAEAAAAEAEAAAREEPPAEAEAAGGGGPEGESIAEAPAAEGESGGVSAAALKARQLALEITRGMAARQSEKAGKARGGVHPLKAPARRGPHFTAEVPVNDLPTRARLTALNKDFMDRITDRYGVAITSRGMYLPPGETARNGERPIYLLLEAADEMALQAAKSEIDRMVQEESLKAPMGGGSSRYRVV